MKLEPITIKGKTFEVHLQQPSGLFTTQLDGNHLEGESLTVLKSKILKAMARNKKVNIPMAAWVPKYALSDRDTKGELRRGVITGIHASNNNLIVKWDDAERPQQLAVYEVSHFVEPSKAGQLAEIGKHLNEMAREFTIAKKRLKDFLDQSGFSGRDRVEEVLAAESSDDDVDSERLGEE